MQDRGHTAGRIEPSATSLALEVLSLLMIDEDLKIVEVSLTVVAPWPSQDLLDIRMLSLGLAHDQLLARTLRASLKCSSTRRMPACKGECD